MVDITYLTQQGYDNLVAEIQYLKSKGRAEITKQIKEAREKGDLSENAEYDAAKEAQGLLELKIAKLDELLANARIMDASKIDTSESGCSHQCQSAEYQAKQGNSIQTCRRKGSRSESK